MVPSRAYRSGMEASPETRHLGVARQAAGRAPIGSPLLIDCYSVRFTPCGRFCPCSSHLLRSALYCCTPLLCHRSTGARGGRSWFSAALLLTACASSLMLAQTRAHTRARATVVTIWAQCGKPAFGKYGKSIGLENRCQHKNHPFDTDEMRRGEPGPGGRGRHVEAA